MLRRAQACWTPGALWPKTYNDRMYIQMLPARRAKRCVHLGITSERVLDLDTTVSAGRGCCGISVSVC